MTRLIPWALPTIPGDSEGGYTPYPTPEPEPEPVDPYDFTNAVIQYNNAQNKIYLWIDSGGNRRVTGNVTGLVVNDLVGVSSVVIAIPLTQKPNAGITVNMDIVSNTVSLRSYVDHTVFDAKAHAISAYQFYVYGADGTIIQTYEKVV